MIDWPGRSRSGARKASRVPPSGAVLPLRRSAATAAGAARVPDPKNRAADVSWPPSGALTAAAKMLSGRSSPRSPDACGTESVLRLCVHVGVPTARLRSSASMYGFTSQYSNQEARRGFRVRLRIVTSCSRSGSSPNGA